MATTKRSPNKKKADRKLPASKRDFFALVAPFAQYAVLPPLGLSSARERNRIMSKKRQREELWANASKIDLEQYAATAGGSSRQRQELAFAEAKQQQKNAKAWLRKHAK